MVKVIVVNKNDEIVGSEEKEVALKKGYIRRIVRVFVFNSKGELFLQKRSGNVETYPNTWDQSAGGHVDEDETYEQSARRELKEELGVEVGELTQVSKFYLEQDFEGLMLKEFSTLYSCVYDGEVLVDQDEVEDGRWFGLEEVRTMINNEPDKFPPGFIQAFSKYQETKYSEA